MCVCLYIYIYIYIYIDNVFFNRNWAGACRGRWAEPGLLTG